MSKKNILHINENIIGILMSMNVCFNIRCLNSHIQRINDIISLEILAFVSVCRIVKWLDMAVLAVYNQYNSYLVRQLPFR